MIKGNTKFFANLTFQEVKALVLNLSLKPDVYNHFMMYEMLMPTHIPQVQDATHLLPQVHIFLSWLLGRLGRFESDERALLQNLEPWIDPTPIFPPVRTVV